MKVKNKLFAIFKNAVHIGNERGLNEEDAINKYVIASCFSEFLNDENFMSKYTAKLAINGFHHHFIKY